MNITRHPLLHCVRGRTAWIDRSKKVIGHNRDVGRGSCGLDLTVGLLECGQRYMAGAFATVLLGSTTGSTMALINGSFASASSGVGGKPSTKKRYLLTRTTHHDHQKSIQNRPSVGSSQKRCCTSSRVSTNRPDPEKQKPERSRPAPFNEQDMAQRSSRDDGARCITQEIDTEQGLTTPTTPRQGAARLRRKCNYVSSRNVLDCTRISYTLNSSRLTHAIL